jgi:Asp-tRNA(Asn)/Glu-tRNA(Gln) amidotransferase A subunit family amidase
LILQVIAGYDPDDPYSIDFPVSDYRAELNAGVRANGLALNAVIFYDGVVEDVRAAVDKVIVDYEQQGGDC